MGNPGFFDAFGLGLIVGLTLAYLLYRLGGSRKAKTPKADIDKLVDEFEEHYREVRRRDANLTDE